MRVVPILLMLVAIVLPNSFAQCKESSLQQEYVSPDRKLIATVLPAGPKLGRGAGRECRVEVRTESGKVLGKSDYSSQDGEDGFGVAYAKWTPDSRFFVYSLENVGGHQLWHSPVQFFSQKMKKIFSLDDLLVDAISNPHFSVIAPDRVKVELYFRKQVQTVSLSSLIRRQH